MARKVLIPQEISEKGKQYLRERGYEIKMGSGMSAEAIKRDVVDCEAVLARVEMYPADVLEAGLMLKVIARHGVGVDNIDVRRAEELGIWVANAPKSNSNTVAEHTVGVIVALAKLLLPTVNSFKGGNYEIRDRNRGEDLEGKTLGIAGIGKIGSLVARKVALGLSMNVIAYDPYMSTDGFPEFVEPASKWEDVFEKSDFVTIHIPANENTKNIVGKREFELMKPSAHFINAARGEIVDESALIAALQEKRIAGAAIDVYENEPPDADNALLYMENVIATPHTAAMTTECMERMALHAAMCIDDVFSGNEPRWPVNKPNPPRSVV